MTRLSAPPPLDGATILAIGLVVYLLENLIHEALGHGGASMLVVGEPLGLSSAWWEADYANVGAWGRRSVRAAGTLANLAAGTAAVALWYRLPARTGPHLRYFVWLFAIVNLFTGGGYLLADPIGNFGDWSGFIAGLHPELPIRIGMVALGLAISLVAARFGARVLREFVATDLGRARGLCLGPYLVGGVAFTLAGLLNPYGIKFALMSALAGFGGTAFLAWLPAWLRRPLAAPAGPTDQPRVTLAIERSRAWIGAGLLAAVFLFVVLGPSVDLRGLD